MKTLKNKLPKMVRESDRNYPKGKDYPDAKIYEQLGNEIGGSIELWFCDGWVIPTLTIQNASSRGRQAGYQRRCYGILVGNSGIVSLGMGPHVTEVVRIYIKKSNFKRLQPLLEIAKLGWVKANQIRDRRSTLALRRSTRGLI